ncbi:hypothetical protein [Chryseobacterium rhizosphaerae]|uniref:hypothetical protein n=1 Tax=Chryseobacterium rhizosphaerae TaxID=395937 RepID=UPI0023584699|nr:hypothetical protein [Chryseobacterium rhizosphaerae]MDC8100532.1 hypothetical protein [Chryseobacterium rhizosphaerae]
MKKIMLKKVLFLPALLLLFTNCKKEDPSKKPIIQNTVTESHTTVPAQKSKDNAQVETVKTFLNWYKNNENKLYGFNTVKGGSQTETETPVNYYVDFDEVEKEIKFLKNSHLFSQKFLSAYEQRYKDGNENFKQHPANDGPPENFDYDYFFLTQEDYQSDLKDIEAINFNIKPVNDTLCSVEFHLKNCGMTYRYILRKTDQWQIDSIENISS